MPTSKARRIGLAAYPHADARHRLASIVRARRRLAGRHGRLNVEPERALPARATYRWPARTVIVRRLTRSYTRTRPRRTTVVVRVQPSIVVQSVPNEAPMLNLPRTLQRPRRRRVFTRARDSRARAATLRPPPPQAGRFTVSVVATLRPELWSTVTAPPETSADALAPWPGVAVMRTVQSDVSRVGAERRR